MLLESGAYIFFLKKDYKVDMFLLGKKHTKKNYSRPHLLGITIVSIFVDILLIFSACVHTSMSIFLKWNLTAYTFLT